MVHFQFKSMKITTSFPAILILLLQESHLGSAELGHNEPCSLGGSANNGSQPQCNFDIGLICADHKGHPVCRCVDESQMEYNKEEDSCQVFVNGKREWTNPTQPDHRTVLPCLDPNQSGYEDSHCECMHGFSPAKGDKLISPDNRCLAASTGHWCDNSTLPCHPKTGLICSRGSCHCPHPLKQNPVGEWYLFQKCLSIPEVVDGCKNKKDSDCVPNAFCGEDNKCHCKPGFILGGSIYYEGIGCFVDYQGSCNNDEDSHAELHCNEAAYLDCYDGKCVCMGEPDLVYDEILHQCTSPEGHVCSLQYESEPESMTVQCRSGLECQALSPGKFLNTGICVKTKKNDSG